MLRPSPQPLGDVCVSIDVGSINTGICLFDGHRDAQKILFMDKQRLLDEHAYVIHDVAVIKQHLDATTATIETLLAGRPYWVLIEQQYFDTEAKHGLVFPLQLESCVAMYYATKGVTVRTIHATTRYGFLGIDGWKQDNRYTRKQRVVNEISKLLEPGVPGNTFCNNNHDLTGWYLHPRRERHDMADALAQCLAYYYRNKVQVMARNPAAVALPSYGQAMQRQAQPTQPTARRSAVQAPSKAHLRGRMERTLAQLGIDYYDLLRGEPSNAAKLHIVYQHNPENKHLLSFLEALHSFNQQGAEITGVNSIQARLTQLLT